MWRDEHVTKKGGGDARRAPIKKALLCVSTLRNTHAHAPADACRSSAFKSTMSNDGRAGSGAGGARAEGRRPIWTGVVVKERPC